MYPRRQNKPNICLVFFPLHFVDTAVIWTHYPHIPWNHVLQFPSTEITPAEEGRTGQQAVPELSRCFGKLGQTDLFVKIYVQLKEK